MKFSNAIRNVERVFMNFLDIASEETIESFEIAVEAMKKQMPMKPKRYIGEYEHENYPICPACGACIRDDNFCFNCGQKIDWED